MGGLRRGRCKYVHVSSVAASMRLTPLRSPPTRPLTGSCAASHERQNKKIKSRSRSLRSSLPDFRCFLVAGQRPALPQSIHAWRGSTADRGNLSKAGWVRWRGCPRHGCRGQAPRGEGALLAKHCFASARTHSRQRLGRSGGLRRPPPPDPPRQPTEPRLLTLTLLRRVQGAALQKKPPYLMATASRPWPPSHSAAATPPRPASGSAPASPSPAPRCPWPLPSRHRRRGCNLR